MLQGWTGSQGSTFHWWVSCSSSQLLVLRFSEINICSSLLRFGKAFSLDGNSLLSAMSQTPRTPIIFKITVAAWNLEDSADVSPSCGGSCIWDRRISQTQNVLEQFVFVSLTLCCSWWCTYRELNVVMLISFVLFLSSVFLPPNSIYLNLLASWGASKEAASCRQPTSHTGISSTPTPTPTPTCHIFSIQPSQVGSFCFSSQNFLLFLFLFFVQRLTYKLLFVLCHKTSSIGNWHFINE